MSDELTRLRAHRAELAKPSTQAWAGAREALVAAIAAERNSPTLPNKRLGRTRVWRLRTAIAATVAIAAVGVVATAIPHSPTPTGSAPPTGTPTPHTVPAAWVVFDRLARVAAAQHVAPAPKGSQYRLTSSESMNTVVFGGSLYDKCTLLVLKYRQTWIDRQGAGAWREREDRPHYLLPSEAGSCEKRESLASMYKNALVIDEVRFAPYCGSTDPVSLRGLPTDAARLRARLENGSIEGGPHTVAQAFSDTGDLLRNTDASPRLRSALYRIAAGLPGVRSLGTVADHAGRRGVGLAIVDRGVWHELIFDPNTSALIGEEEKTTARPAGAKVPVGTTIGWDVYYPSLIVSSEPPPRASPHTRIDNCHGNTRWMRELLAQKKRAHHAEVTAHRPVGSGR